MSSTEIVVLATARAKPGREADLEAALTAAEAPTRAQPGCLRFELLRPAADAAAVTAYERWASAADHERHLQGPHLKTLMGKFETILDGPPQIVVLRPL